MDEKINKVTRCKLDGLKHYAQMYVINNNYATDGKPLPYSFERMSSTSMTLCYTFNWDSICVGRLEKEYLWEIVCTYEDSSYLCDHFIYNEDTEEIKLPWEA